MNTPPDYAQLLTIASFGASAAIAQAIALVTFKTNLAKQSQAEQDKKRSTVVLLTLVVLLFWIGVLLLLSAATSALWPLGCKFQHNAVLLFTLLFLVGWVFLGWVGFQSYGPSLWSSLTQFINWLLHRPPGGAGVTVKFIVLGKYTDEGAQNIPATITDFKASVTAVKNASCDFHETAGDYDFVAVISADQPTDLAPILHSIVRDKKTATRTLGVIGS